MAFPRNARLQKSSIISIIQKKGSLWKTPFFRIRYLPSRNGKTKIAFITPKSLEPKAVKRNRTRRKLSAAFYDHALSLKKPLLLLIYPTSNTYSAPFADIKKAVEFSFSKLSSLHYEPRKKHNNKHPNPKYSKK